MKFILLFLVIFGVTCSFGRHIHPHHRRNGQWRLEQVEIDGMTVDMLRKVLPTNGFVPVNNMVYFRKQEPCEEGLKRDLFGICREVWDD